MPSRIRSVFTSALRDDNGTTAVIFSLLLIPIFGLIAISLDVGRATAKKSEIQVALDAAILSAMSKPESERVAAALTYFNANMPSAAAAGIVPTFTASGSTGLSGSVSATVKTFFGRLLGKNQVTVTAENEAVVATSQGRVCVLLVDPTGSQSLLVNSGANVVAPDCEIHVRSTGNPAAIFNSGSTLNTKRICIKGSTIIDNGGTHPNLEKSCVPATDTYAGTIPTPSSTACTVSNANYSGSSVTLSPGVYCGWINFNNGVNVNLNPGLYVIKGGGWNVNGGMWTGNGVTFYYDDTSKIQFNSGIRSNLKAPTSGQWADILMAEKPGLSVSDFIFNDSAGSTLDGLMYLPSRNVTFNTASEYVGQTVTAVFNRLILNTTSWNIAPGEHAIASGSSSSGAGEVALVR